VEHARALADLGIPFMFDPGQGLPMFPARSCSPSSSRRLPEVNDYEAGMLEERTGRKLPDLARARALDRHAGAEGPSSTPRGSNRHSLRQGKRRPGSHRLRRCVPRGHALRHASGFDWQKTEGSLP